MTLWLALGLAILAAFIVIPAIILAASADVEGE